MHDVSYVQDSSIQGLDVEWRQCRASATKKQSSTFFRITFGKTEVVAKEVGRSVEVLIEDAKGCGKKAREDTFVMQMGTAVCDSS